MGSCHSLDNTVSPENKNSIMSTQADFRQSGVSSVSSSRKKAFNKSTKNQISLQDFMGIKHSDSIENFYDIDCVIGRGAFGEVVKAQHIYSNETRAIKIIQKGKLKKHALLMQLQLQELNVLMRTDHPNLMKVYEIMEDNGHYYIMSELMRGGELYERILKLKRFTEKDCANIVWQILRGLNYMHKQNIVHRDIKPENILMESQDTNNLNLKITDFGFARCYDPKEGGLTDKLGSPLYMAPEIIKQLPYDSSVDIWALGVLCYIMLSGKPPFKGSSKDEIFVQITSKNITYTGEIWKNTSKEAKNFVKKMLIRDSKQRHTAENLLQDEWIQQYHVKDIISDDFMIDVSHNLQQFKNFSTFQTAILTYIVSQHETDDYFKKLREVFQQMDESGDGFLQIDEIQLGLKQVLGNVKGNMKIFDDIMASLDKNCNGVVDFTEFLTAAADKDVLLSEKNLRMVFNMFDKDHNGSISKKELKDIFETSEQKDEQLWDEIFEQVDFEGHGEISFDEFKATMDKVVEKKSKNKYISATDSIDYKEDEKQKNDQQIKKMFFEPQQGY